MENTEIKRELLTPGSKYTHYKHKEQFYEIIGIGIHSETLEEMVIYRALYNSPEWGENRIWVRPISMFFDYKDIDGQKVPRFTKVS